MDDFAVPNATNAWGQPPSPKNFPEPGKRPLSSMCPAIIVDKDSGRVKMIIGGAGGTKITSAVSYVS
jgi:gamma-glutamyltranspeptidase/glutathione hydrolase/leukotriene-C4 hydrolase